MPLGFRKACACREESQTVITRALCESQELSLSSTFIHRQLSVLSSVDYLSNKQGAVIPTEAFLLQTDVYP